MQLAVSIVLFVEGTALAETTINSMSVADGTTIHTTYPGELRFSCFGARGPSSNVLQRSIGALNSVHSNVVSTIFGVGSQEGKDSVGGAIEVSFATRSQAVSIEKLYFFAPEGPGNTGFGYFQPTTAV